MPHVPVSASDGVAVGFDIAYFEVVAVRGEVDESSGVAVVGVHRVVPGHGGCLGRRGQHGGTCQAARTGEQAEFLGHRPHVHRLPHVESDSEAHLAAGAYMIDRVDEPWAVMNRSALLTCSELQVADADHQMGLPERLVRRQSRAPIRF